MLQDNLNKKSSEVCNWLQNICQDSNTAYVDHFEAVEKRNNLNESNMYLNRDTTITSANNFLKYLNKLYWCPSDNSRDLAGIYIASNYTKNYLNNNTSDNEESFLYSEESYHYVSLKSWYILLISETKIDSPFPT